MSFDWYPWHIQKYRKRTMHLGLAECGAYRRLIDEYMMTGAPLPDNDAALSRIIGVSKDDWLAVAVAVRPFFDASNGKLINKTCEEELHAQASQAHATSIKNKAAANSRWAKHRELQQFHTGAYQPHTPRMPNDATRQDTTLKLSSVRDAALARSPDGEHRAAPQNTTTTIIAAKRPSDMTRKELDEQIAARRAAPGGTH